MTRSARIRLQWVEKPPESALAPGWRFSTPARFDHQDDERWKREAWSVVILTDTAIDAMGSQSATAAFLFPNAPQHWLAVGNSFTLYTNKPVARALIESVSEK